MSKVPIVENIMSANDQIAAKTRQQFDELGILALNVMASPGGGKTSVIMRTVESLKNEARIGVMDGDMVTIDADHIAELGVPVSLINTGGNCHLDANMVHSALPSLDLDAIDLLIIENVGNLICPAAFKLGVHLNVVIASVPEGDDKPYKYPAMFRGADVLLLNKIDLKPYLQFDVDYFQHGVEVLNPGLTFFQVSATTGEGFDAWLAWLRDKIKERSSAGQP
ncbi:MAG: hydrogenase nickel incorporation protein HypB [Anaerolineae bacterium]|jgi:hydrogenase nickel incorporation protein HypB|nr:hydrogenase nickel incorporation protein HypB [Anaerolineae bacterium]